MDSDDDYVTESDDSDVSVQVTGPGEDDPMDLDTPGWHSPRRTSVVIDAGENPTRPWHNYHPALYHLGLKDMNRLGYIDYLTAPKPQIDPIFGIGALPPGDVLLGIHPIFDKPLWAHKNFDNDWELIKPVARLASCFLMDPYVMTFFHGLLVPSPPRRILNNPALFTRHGNQNYYQFLPKSLVDPQGNTIPNLQRVDQVFRRMARKVRWIFAKSDCHGTTLPDPRHTNVQGIYPGTHVSEIRLNIRYLRVLRGDLASTIFPRARAFDPEAARHKTMLGMAVTMIHELAHATVYANIPGLGPEPWFLAERLNETGHALEKHIFRLVLNATGQDNLTTDCAVTFPYGMSGDSWPGFDNPGLNEHARGSKSRYGITSAAQWIFPAASTHRFFTRQFWQVDVPRQGSQAFKKIRLDAQGRSVGFRHHLNGPNEPFWANEPQIALPIPPSPVVPTRDQIRAIGFEHPSPPRHREIGARNTSTRYEFRPRRYRGNIPPQVPEVDAGVDVPAFDDQNLPT